MLHLDYNKTAEAFVALGLKDFNSMYSQAAQTGLFDDFEKGLISVNYFINTVLNYLPKGTTPNQVVSAWNAMILDFPVANLELLLQLKQKHRIFLLSNTNEIHIQCFSRRLKEVTDQPLSNFFEKVYFSSDMQLRKPNVTIFERVCTENGLEIAKTLFIDDTLQHIEGARSAGLKTLHFQDGAPHLVQLFS